jgi:hypothetical protein
MADLDCSRYARLQPICQRWLALLIRTFKLDAEKRAIDKGAGADLIVSEDGFCERLRAAIAN